ncbi:Carboxypeptidase regulatory-like domain protein [uncultured archaeon]|nr:Carboxypeptidase regulatory-like domain protein [uncultured archaeon]
MTKKLNRITNIITVLMALLLLGIAAGPASAADTNILVQRNVSGGTNVTINGTTSPFGTDNFNQTYTNKVEALNFTININTTAAGTNNLTNVSIDFTGTGITLLPTFSNIGVADSSLLLSTAAGLIPNVNQANGGWNQTNTNVSVTSTSINFTSNASSVGTEINSSALLWVNVTKARMPSSAGNVTITIYAYNRTVGIGTNVTTVTLQVLADSTAPTVTNLTMNGLNTSSFVINNTVGGFPYQTGRNISNLNYTFDINETTAGFTSGINYSTIQVWFDYGSPGAVLAINTNTTMAGLTNTSLNNTNLILNRTRNVTISADGNTINFATLGNLTASTTGTAHTLYVIARDNSTNEYNATTQTFYMPRIILGANRTSGVTANNTDRVKIFANFLKPDGSADTRGAGASGADNVVTWQAITSGATVVTAQTNSLNSTGGQSVTDNDVLFTTAGAKTIRVSYNGTSNDIVITAVAAVANGAAGINGVTTTTSGTLVANGTDSLNLSIQAIDSSGNVVLKSGRLVTVTQTGTAASLGSTAGYTDSNGMINFTVTSTTTAGTVTFQPTIQLENLTAVNTNTVTVTVGTGPVRFMIVNTSVNGSSNAGTSYIGLGKASPGANVSVDSLAAGNTTIISVFLTDDGNHTIASSTVNFALSGSGSLSATSATTNSTGFASVTFTSGTVAANLSSIINVTSASNATLFTYVRVNTTNGSANKIVLTANRTGLATSTVASVNASIQDVYGNAVNVSGVNVTFSIISGASLGTLSRNFTLTDTTGTAGTNFTAGSTAGTVVIQANSTTMILPGSPGNITNITLTIGVPDGMTLTLNKTNMPTTANATNGAPIVATAQLTTGGSPIGASGVNVTFLITSGSIFDPNNGTVGTNNGTSIVVQTNSSGIAQAQVNGSGTVGTATLTAADTDNPAIATQIGSITFTGSPTTFTLTNGTISSSAGVSSTNVTVQLKDSAGNNVGSANGVTFVVTGGNLSASSGTTNASTGQLTVTLSANTASGAVSPMVTAFISGMSPTSVSLTVNMPQTAANGTISGTVTNATSGAAISGATVAVTSAGVSTTTDTNGNYSISIAAGTYTVTASATGYQTKTTTGVVVTSGSVTTLNLALTPTVGVPILVSSITPNSRNAQVGTPVTLFMSVINGGTATATNVSIAQASGLPVNVSYTPWNGTAFTGPANTPVNIAAGGTANFVLAINATSAFSSSSLTFNVSGTNAAAAPISGVNTLTISASATPLPDIIMISTTLNVSTAVSTATSFAIATSNVGATATGVSLNVVVPSSITGLAYQVNQTNATTGAIIGPATGLTINAGAQPTFAVFLQPTQPIAFDPTNNRITLQLVDGTGRIVGAQSVAISTT